MANLLDIEKNTLLLRREFGRFLLEYSRSAVVQGSLIRFELPLSCRRELAKFSLITFTYYVAPEKLVVTLTTKIFIYNLPWSSLSYILFE